MKTSFIFRVLLAGLFLGLLAVGCQKDNVATIPEGDQEQIQAFKVPEVPAEIAQHFTEEELAAFRAGPSQEMLDGVESRAGSWHPLVVMYEMELYHRPVTNSCEEPVICTNLMECSNPYLWVGYAVLYTFEGTWFGHGPITGGSSGSIHCNTGEVFPPSQTWVSYGDNELYFTGERLSSVSGNNGSIVLIDRFDYTGGTGMFDGAYGYAYGRTYAHQDDLPDLFAGTPGHAIGFTMGWLHY